MNSDAYFFKICVEIYFPVKLETSNSGRFMINNLFLERFRPTEEEGEEKEPGCPEQKSSALQQRRRFRIMNGCV